MIAIKMLGPRVELTPVSRRRAAVALGLALAAALMRVGRFESVEICTWRGVPNAAHVSGKRLNVELSCHVDVGVVEDIAGELRRWDGVTLALSGVLGRAELGVEIDIYAGKYVPVQAGIVNEGVDVLAEPRCHVGGSVVESFYELFDAGREEMRAVFEKFVAEMCNIKLKAATRAEAGTRPLWRLVAGVYALRDYSFAPEDTAPLWYRPWVGQMAKYLYRLAPPGLKELVGLYGMRRVVGNAAPELLKYLARHFDATQHEDALQLVPLSAGAHRGAVAELKEVLAEAMKAAAGARAQKIINKKGHLDWEEYVKVLEEELRQRLRAPA